MSEGWWRDSFENGKAWQNANLPKYQLGLPKFVVLAAVHPGKDIKRNTRVLHKSLSCDQYKKYTPNCKKFFFFYFTLLSLTLPFSWNHV
jgi:hypothetical protein